MMRSNHNDDNFDTNKASKSTVQPTLPIWNWNFMTQYVGNPFKSFVQWQENFKDNLINITI